MKWALLAVAGAAAVFAIIAAKKAAPAISGNVSRTPNSVSPSEFLPPYSTLIGVGGLSPVISFPDINGTSANVTQPV
jgi:hypothetical protein